MTEVVRVQRLARPVEDRKGELDLPLLSVSATKGVVPRSRLTSDEPRAEDLTNYRVCRAGDLVVNRMSAYQGALGQARQDGIVSPDYLVLRPNSRFNVAYGEYLMKTPWFVSQMASRVRGIGSAELATVRTPRINWSDLGQIEVPLPDVARQQRIAEFLDRETAQIDELIAKQEQLISTLAERRSAVIHSALTKGLSNSADSRESGVYWLGPIPTEWRVNKFSRVVRINGGQVDPREDSYASMLLVAPNHIEKETGRLLDQETAAEQGADSGKYLVKAGQVIYSKIRPALRKATIAPRDCLCSADMYAMSPDPSHLRESFLLYLLLSRPFTQFVTDVSSRVAMPKVNQEALALAYLWYPSLAEQDRIVDHLIAVTEQLDDLAAKAATVVEVLRERRQALISAAVTGKIDVGGAS